MKPEKETVSGAGLTFAHNIERALALCMVSSARSGHHVAHGNGPGRGEHRRLGRASANSIARRPVGAAKNRVRARLCGCPPRHPEQRASARGLASRSRLAPWRVRVELIGIATRTPSRRRAPRRDRAAVGCVLDWRARMSTLKGKTLFITGASRGIGKAIALRAARDGANVVIAAKTDRAAPQARRAPSTPRPRRWRRRAAKRSRASSTSASRTQIQAAVDGKRWTKFGGIDILVNNASAISLTGTLRHADEALRPHAPDQHARHVRVLAGVLAAPAEGHEPARPQPLAAARHAARSGSRPHVAYTMAKFGMSLCVLGMAGEFRRQGIAVNALWPRTVIATAAVQNLLGGDATIRGSRTPDIMADAAYAILTRPSRECTGNFFIDDDVLRADGVTDLVEVPDGPRARSSSPTSSSSLARATWARDPGASDGPRLSSKSHGRDRSARDASRDPRRHRRDLARGARGRRVGPPSRRGRRGPDGAPVVAGIDVEELFGDEARVDAVFDGDGIRAVLPVLAKAVEALCALDELDARGRARRNVRAHAERALRLARGPRPGSQRSPRRRARRAPGQAASEERRIPRALRPSPRRPPGRRSRHREGRLDRDVARAARRARHAHRDVLAAVSHVGVGRHQPSRSRGRPPGVLRGRRRHRRARPLGAVDSRLPDRRAHGLGARRVRLRSREGRRGGVRARERGPRLLAAPRREVSEGDRRHFAGRCLATAVRLGRVTPFAALRGEVRAEHVARDDVGLHLPGRPVDDQHRDGDLPAPAAAGRPARSR